MQGVCIIRKTVNMGTEKESKGQSLEKPKKEVVGAPVPIPEEVQGVVAAPKKPEVIKPEVKRSLIVKGYSRVDRSFRKNNK